MIIFDRLEVSPDGKYLDIHAHVNEASMFNDRYIKGVYVVTDEGFDCGNPSNSIKHAVFKKTYVEPKGK